MQRRCCSPISNADWPSATFLELLTIHMLCGSLCWAWVCVKRTNLCTKADFYEHQDLGRVTCSLKSLKDLPSPASFLLGLSSESASISTTEQSLSATRIPAGGTVAYPQADATWRGEFCLRKLAPASWGMTQHGDPDGWPFTYLPRATYPRLFSHCSSLFCPSSAGAQGKWLQTKFCVLSVSLAVSPYQKTHCFSQTDTVWVLSWLWCPVWGLDPTILRWTTSPQPLKYTSGTLSVATGSPGSHLVPPWFLPILI